MNEGFIKEEAEREIIIEAQKPLHLSMLRRMQRTLYKEHGNNACENKVPWLLTGNAYMAKAYAHVILGYLQDCELNAINPAQPIHIVELGAGSGRFSYLLLKKLQALRLQSPLPTPAFRYVMTDFTQENIDSWRGHPALQPFIEDGLLDFALFDAENDSRLLLQESGIVLAPETNHRSVIVLANAFFSTLIQHVFRVQTGNLEQGLVTLYVTEPAPPDPQMPLKLDQIKVRYDFKPVPHGYYQDPEFKTILQNTSDRSGDCAFSFPIGALRCMRSLLRISQNRLLLLSTDMGHTERQDQLAEMPPVPVTHDGCFALPVNYHAIAQYFQDNTNSRVWHMATRRENLCISGMVCGEAFQSFPATRFAFSEYIENFELSDIHNLFSVVHASRKKKPLLTLLSMIRLSEYDTKVFCKLSDAILDEVDAISYEHEIELLQVLERVWDNWYYEQSSLIDADQIASIYYTRHRYAKSLFVAASIMKYHGERAESLSTIGRCLYKMNMIHQALSFFNRALEIDKNHETIRLWRVRLEDQLELLGPYASKNTAEPAVLSTLTSMVQDGHPYPF